MHIRPPTFNNAALRKRHHTYPELGHARRCRLGFLVGGKFGSEAVQFLRLLARHRAAAVPRLLRPYLVSTSTQMVHFACTDMLVRAECSARTCGHLSASTRGSHSACKDVSVCAACSARSYGYFCATSAHIDRVFFGSHTHGSHSASTDMLVRAHCLALFSFLGAIRRVRVACRGIYNKLQ